VVGNTVSGTTVSNASCTGRVATGGGFFTSDQDPKIRQSAPTFNNTLATQGQVPNGWMVQKNGGGTITAYVICAN
jgi:hypothetical protein